jgi:hypothetical protein
MFNLIKFILSGVDRVIATFLFLIILSLILVTGVNAVKDNFFTSSEEVGIAKYEKCIYNHKIENKELCKEFLNGIQHEKVPNLQKAK